MKCIMLLLLFAVIPLFAHNSNFVYYDYGGYDDGYWYDEYWQDDYYSDGNWAYYPHGYYCVRFVWWYPWWWDWFWWRASWCHSFSWDFFYCGFYTVWYDGGSWWYRPRYGRSCRYRLPYAYGEIRRRMKTRGYYLPDKPPREISIPYKEHEVRNLMKQRDPEAFARIEKEHGSGNLERMRTRYVAKTQKEIERKNQEYKAQQAQPTRKHGGRVTTERSTQQYTSQPHGQKGTPRTESQSRIVKKSKSNRPQSRQTSRYNRDTEDAEQKTSKQKSGKAAVESEKPKQKGGHAEPANRYKKAPERGYQPHKTTRKQTSEGHAKDKR